MTPTAGIFDRLRALFRPSPVASPPESITVVPEWPIYSQVGWTVDQVDAVLRQQEVGASLRWSESLLLSMTKNPMYAHGLRTRVNATLGVEWDYQVTEGCPALQAEELENHLPDLWAGGLGPSALATATKYRTTIGVAPVNVTWKLSPTGRTWLPVLHAREAGWLSYFPTEARYKFTHRTGQSWVVPDGREWLLFAETLSSAYPHQDGNIRVLAAVWWMFEAVVRYWQNYSRVHGNPQRKIKGPAVQRESLDVKEFIKQAQQLTGGSTVFCPQYPNGVNFDFDLVCAEFSTYETFPRFIDYVQSWMTLVWLGAVDNTQGGPAGSRARAVVHERVSLQYLAADCRLTAAPLLQLLRTWARMNRIDPATAPVLTPLWQPPGDEKEAAQVRQANGAALASVVPAAQLIEGRGVKVDWRALGEAHGIPCLDGTPDAPTLPDPGPKAAARRIAYRARGQFESGRGWQRQKVA